MSIRSKSIVRWFIVCFISYSLIFFIALLPLISYCNGVFTELEIKKSTQKMDFGISQIENTVSGISSAAYALKQDIRFIPLLYLEPDYSCLTSTVRNQMRDFLNALVYPLDLVSHCALLFSDTAVITSEVTLFDENPKYYPTLFSVQEKSFSEWEAQLTENKVGILPVQNITVNRQTYDALIYATSWTDTSYLYACMRIDNIRNALIDKSNLDNYLITIRNTRGDILFTDLNVSDASAFHQNDSLSGYHTVSQKTAVGSLIVSVHIPHAALTERMRPLYYFLILYLGLCILTMIATAYIGAHISSMPLLRILRIFEDNDAAAGDTDARQPDCLSDSETSSPLHHGFHYIQSKIQDYEISLNTYRSTIKTQEKVLQARFMEKALHGSLATENDYNAFYSYFPDFPENYYLVLFGISEQTMENDAAHDNLLSLLQTYLQMNLPLCYQQQLSNTKLLLIIDEESYTHAADILNHLLNKTNTEETGCHTWAISSNLYSHPKNLPIAYWQLQDLSSRISLDSLGQLCAITDYPSAKNPGFQIRDALSIHSAIVCGNKDIALQKLESYREMLVSGNRPVFDMFRAILLCIKQEHANELTHMDVPSYRDDITIYDRLKDVISLFCEQFHTKTKTTDSSQFIQDVKNYIDLHFTQENMCYATLTEHFHCSTSKLQKAFSKEVGVSLSAYIEQKRMELADELLKTNAHSVTEVARMCGFSNDNTFYKAYKRTFGHSPTALK